jgi:hypothetical protein
MICHSLPGWELTRAQIRSLPDLAIVLQSGGVSSSDPSFTDDFTGGKHIEAEEVEDPVKQMLFHPIGSRTPRSHLLVSRPMELTILMRPGTASIRTSEHIRSSTAVHRRFLRPHAALLGRALPQSPHPAITYRQHLQTALCSTSLLQYRGPDGRFHYRGQASLDCLVRCTSYSSIRA